MNNISCYIDNVRYKDKPSGRVIGGIQNRFKTAEYLSRSANDVIKALESGYTIALAECENREKERFKQSNSLALDFDNGHSSKFDKADPAKRAEMVKAAIGSKQTISPEEIKARCREYGFAPPAFIYKTFSWGKYCEACLSLEKQGLITSSECDRIRATGTIRAVWVFDQTITDKTVYDELCARFCKFFSECDPSFNIAGVLFGTKFDDTIRNDDSVLDVTAFLQLALPAECEVVPSRAAAPPKYVSSRQQPQSSDMTADRLAEIILNSRCDFGADGYSLWRNTCCWLFQNGVPSETIAEWSRTYDGTTQNPAQWENSPDCFSIGTAKKATQILNPAAFDTYKRELSARSDFKGHFKTQALDWDGTPAEDQSNGSESAQDQSEDSNGTPQELPADPRKWTEEQWQLFAEWHYKTPFDPDSAAAFNRFKYLYIQCWKHRLLKYEKLPEYIQPTCKVKKIGGFEQSVITGFCINPIPLARDLVESLHIINIPSSAQGLLYIYKGGKYVKIDPEQERGIIRGRLETFDRDGAMWNTKTIRDCSTILHSPLETHSLDDFNADENLINFKNGLLDLSTGELRPHDPAVLSTVQLPLDYDPNAGTETPCFDNMIEHLSSGNEEVKKMLLQICALAVSNINIGRLKMFLLMYGARDSGKSMLFTLLSRLLGEENTHATNLYLLEENRFETMNACGKRLVGTPELDNNSVVHHVGIIKALTGGDLIRAEIKCGGTYNFRYRGVILFSSNDKPRLPSADAAFYNRLRLVEVPRSIKDKDPYFIEKLYAERQRIINKLLPYLTETLQARAVIDPETSKKLKFAYKADNAIEIMFFNECCTMRDLFAKVTDNQTRTYIYGKFRDWCYENGIKDIPSSRDFTKRLDSYILEEKLNTWGAKLDKRNGRFFTFTYHDPNHAQTFAAEVQNVESVTDLPPW